MVPRHLLAARAGLAARTAATFPRNPVLQDGIGSLRGVRGALAGLSEALHIVAPGGAQATVAPAVRGAANRHVPHAGTVVPLADTATADVLRAAATTAVVDLARARVGAPEPRRRARLLNADVTTRPLRAGVLASPDSTTNGHTSFARSS